MDKQNTSRGTNVPSSPTRACVRVSCSSRFRKLKVKRIVLVKQLTSGAVPVKQTISEALIPKQSTSGAVKAKKSTPGGVTAKQSTPGAVIGKQSTLEGGSQNSARVSCSTTQNSASQIRPTQHNETFAPASAKGMPSPESAVNKQRKDHKTNGKKAVRTRPRSKSVTGNKQTNRVADNQNTNRVADNDNQNTNRVADNQNTNRVADSSFSSRLGAHRLSCSRRYRHLTIRRCVKEQQPGAGSGSVTLRSVSGSHYKEQTATTRSCPVLVPGGESAACGSLDKRSTVARGTVTGNVSPSRMSVTVSYSTVPKTGTACDSEVASHSAYTTSAGNVSTTQKSVLESGSASQRTEDEIGSVALQQVPESSNSTNEADAEAIYTTQKTVLAEGRGTLKEVLGIGSVCQKCGSSLTSKIHGTGSQSKENTTASCNRLKVHSRLDPYLSKERLDILPDRLCCSEDSHDIPPNKLCCSEDSHDITPGRPCCSEDSHKIPTDQHVNTRPSSLANLTNCNKLGSQLRRTDKQQRAHRVKFFRNGDRFYQGLLFPVSTERFRTFDSLLTALNGSSLCDFKYLPHGVKFIFTLDGTRRVERVGDFQDGQCYVCSSLGHFRSLDYTRNKDCSWNTPHNSVSLIRESFLKQVRVRCQDCDKPTNQLDNTSSSAKCQDLDKPTNQLDPTSSNSQCQNGDKPTNHLDPSSSSAKCQGRDKPTNKLNLTSPSAQCQYLDKPTNWFDHTPSNAQCPDAGEATCRLYHKSSHSSCPKHDKTTIRLEQTPSNALCTGHGKPTRQLMTTTSSPCIVELHQDSGSSGPHNTLDHHHNLWTPESSGPRNSTDQLSRCISSSSGPHKTPDHTLLCILCTSQDRPTGVPDLRPFGDISNPAHAGWIHHKNQNLPGTCSSIQISHSRGSDLDSSNLQCPVSAKSTNELDGTSLFSHRSGCLHTFDHSHPNTHDQENIGQLKVDSSLSSVGCDQTFNRHFSVGHCTDNSDPSTGFDLISSDVRGLDSEKSMWDVHRNLSNSYCPVHVKPIGKSEHKANSHCPVRGKPTDESDRKINCHCPVLVKPTDESDHMASHCSNNCGTTTDQEHKKNIGCMNVFERMAEHGGLIPRLVFLVRFGRKPRKIFRLLLNRKSAKSLEQVMTDINELVVFDLGRVRKVYTLTGRQVTSLVDFFQEDTVFLVCGQDKPQKVDFRLDEREAAQTRLLRLSYHRQDQQDNDPANQRRDQQSKKPLLSNHRQDQPDKEPCLSNQKHDQQNKKPFLSNYRQDHQNRTLCLSNQRQDPLIKKSCLSNYRRDQQDKTTSMSNQRYDDHNKKPCLSNHRRDQQEKELCLSNQKQDQQKNGLSLSNQRLDQNNKMPGLSIYKQDQQNKEPYLSNHRQDQLNEELFPSNHIQDPQDRKSRLSYHRHNEQNQKPCPSIPKHDQQNKKQCPSNQGQDHQNKKPRLSNHKKDRQDDKSRPFNHRKKEQNKKPFLCNHEKVPQNETPHISNHKQDHQEKKPNLSNHGQDQQDKKALLFNNELHLPGPNVLHLAESSIPEQTPTLPNVLKNKYQTGALLGTGQFSVVFECRDRKTSRVYGLKIVDKQVCTGKEDVVENEAVILRCVKHPNIIRLLEDFSNPVYKYYLMELVEGDLLLNLTTSGVRGHENDVRWMLRDLASALQYLHSLHIVHRDVQPGNIVVRHRLNGATTLKLGDFGLATEVRGPLYTLCGNPAYVAPEVIAETGYGVKVDVWSAGVIVYCLLCGFLPFLSPKGDQKELLQLILTGRHDYPHPYWDHVTSTAKCLVSGMLEANPVKRMSACQLLEHQWVSSGGRSGHDTEKKTLVRGLYTNFRRPPDHANTRAGVKIISATALDKTCMFFKNGPVSQSGCQEQIG